MASDEQRKNLTSATDRSSVLLLVSQPEHFLQALSAEPSGPKHLVALGKWSRLGAPAHFSLLVVEAHSRPIVCSGLFLPQFLWSPFLGKQIIVISTRTASPLGNTLSDLAQDLKPPLSTCTTPPNPSVFLLGSHLCL